MIGGVLMGFLVKEFGMDNGMGWNGIRSGWLGMTLECEGGGLWSL